MTITSTFRRGLLAAGALALALSATAYAGTQGDASAQKIDTVHPGKITFAFRSDDRPVSFIQNGQPAGFMIDLGDAMAEKIGLKASYVSTDFASMLPDVRNHKYDSAAFGVLVTPPRQKVVNFTSPVKYGEAMLISPKDDPIKTIDQASGKTVAITVGSALIPLLQKMNPKVQVKQFPNIAASLLAMESHQVAGLFTGVSTTKHLLDKHSDLTSTQALITGPAAFPVAKDNPALLKALDKALDELVADGTYTKLFDKWHPANQMIPDAMLKRYPKMKQRPSASAKGS